MIDLFMRMKIYFMEYNYRHLGWKDIFSVFWKNLLFLYKRIIRYKIIFRIIWLDKKEYSYLTVDLGEIKSSEGTRGYNNKGYTGEELLNDGTKRWNHKYNWDKLEKDLKRYKLVKRLEVHICNELDPESNKYCKYCISDGNHRITVLKELYPPTYKVKIKLNNNVLNK